MLPSKTAHTRTVARRENRTTRETAGTHPHLAFYIDAGAGDVARAMRELSYGSNPSRHDALRHRLQAEWTRLAHGPLSFGVESDAIATLSVRTGLDLFLRVSAYPRGSAVLMTAINIPDMVKIIEHHGLVPVPVDLEVETLAPTAARLREAVAACTTHTGSPPVAIVVAHVYGRRSSLDDVVAIASETGMLVVEDCAEAFSGLDYLGDDRADISLFSFGGIKCVPLSRWRTVCLYLFSRAIPSCTPMRSTQHRARRARARASTLTRPPPHLLADTTPHLGVV